MRGQVVAIAFVIGGGVTTYLVSSATLESLLGTQRTYYREYDFAEVFASLKRAPERVADRLRDLDGVRAVETRVVAQVNLDIEGYPDPINGRIVSLPETGQPELNRLFVRTGSLPERRDEVAVSEAFAEAQALGPGDRLGAIINGRREDLTITGVVSSPEFVYQIAPGAMFPDFERYGILWMREKALATAYDMDGAFNDVVLTVERGASVQSVVGRLDRLLEPWGGQGAYARSEQTSHRYLEQELESLRVMARIFPVIFLGVAAFLLNVVMTRLIAGQREQVGILKAFGYGDVEIGLHYAQFVLVVVALGTALGVAAGSWLGNGMARLYADFYRFPFLEFVLRPHVVAVAFTVAAVAALAGTFRALYRAARLPPAEAMRPEPPPRYARTWLERMGLYRWLDQPTRMIMRHLHRQPVKALLTLIGIAFSVGILVVGRFQESAIDYMVQTQYGLAAREDITVTFAEPTSRAALFELAAIPGTGAVEPFRSVPVRLRFGHREQRLAIQGLAEERDLHRLLDTNLETVRLPEGGVLLTEYLAETLEVEVGDTVGVQVLEGARPTRELRVAGLVAEYIGINAYMRLGELNRMMGEGHAISGAYLAVDRDERAELFRELKETPRVAGVGIQSEAIRSFYETLADTILIFTFVNTILAGTIAVGVVYNSARIAYSERARELASLRVLGFRRAEVSYILLGELALLTLLALPLGFVLGWALCWFFAASLQSDIYRVPLVVERSTFAFAATVVLAAAAASGWLIRRKVDRLDLIGALKTRE
jgi:putative ABC transport system permease protein